MQWVVAILGKFIEKPSLIVAAVLCFCFWVWLDHSDKRYLAEMIHGDLLRIESAIDKNTQKVDTMLFQISQFQRD